MSDGHNPTSLLVQHAIAKYEADCHAAMNMIRGAASVGQVRQLMQVHTPSWIAAVVRSLPVSRQLENAAEEQVRKIGRARLAMLVGLSGEAAEAALAQIRREVLHPMRGEFASQFRLLERELARVERDLKREGPPAP